MVYGFAPVGSVAWKFLLEKALSATTLSQEEKDLMQRIYFESLENKSKAILWKHENNDLRNMLIAEEQKRLILESKYSKLKQRK